MDPKFMFLIFLLIGSTIVSIASIIQLLRIRRRIKDMEEADWKSLAIWLEYEREQEELSSRRVQ